MHLLLHHELLIFFSTTSHENECIELLLDFVQDIYLTPENVEKKKELLIRKMVCDDDPDWRCYFW